MIASRVFEPEPSAASFRLRALADALVESGHEVLVVTAKTPRRLRKESHDSARDYRVRRFPVLRDRSGYVRGYLQYLSFDLPLFFRLIFAAKPGLIIAEPPPTTGVVTRLAARLRRVPYAYYAADIWSDASASTSAPGMVVRVVRMMERLAASGAQSVLSVNLGVTNRVHEIAPDARVHTIGNGVDTSIFTVEGLQEEEAPYFIYAGTASEWQGADIFIEAFANVRQEYPNARLIFLGQGSDRGNLRSSAERLPSGSVEFMDIAPPVEAARWLRGAVASIASIRPESGYHVAFPTKVLASWSVGIPVIFAGEGPVVEFMKTHDLEARLGEFCEYDEAQVASAMRRALEAVPTRESREKLGRWAEQKVSLSAVAQRAVYALIDAEAKEPGV